MSFKVTKRISKAYSGLELCLTLLKCFRYVMRNDQCAP